VTEVSPSEAFGLVRDAMNALEQAAQKFVAAATAIRVAAVAAKYNPVDMEQIEAESRRLQRFGEAIKQHLQHYREDGP
jgi:hypothetical protein